MLNNEYFEILSKKTDFLKRAAHPDEGHVPL